MGFLEDEHGRSGGGGLCIKKRNKTVECLKKYVQGKEAMNIGNSN